VKKFSERIGAKEPRKFLQIDSMDNNLRNSLWNILIDLYEDDHGNRKNYWIMVSKYVAQFFAKIPVDELPFQNYECRKWLKIFFYKLIWYEVYDFIEYIVNEHENMTKEKFRYNQYSYHIVQKSELLYIMNSILDRELSGYRFISGILSPITDIVEIESIENAIRDADALKLIGVKEHIRTAIELLGKRPQPDYRNAIKEAISSVESIVQVISHSKSKGLSNILNEILKKTYVHPALKEGFIKLYGYSSDEDGIRHAILEQPNISFAEAKYMIISCSAFVNYLIDKGNQMGLFK